MRGRLAFHHPRYRLVAPLGEGGMGKVYLARDLLDGSDVALKVYPARRYDERLRAEFLALKDLHHPGIARALHFGVLERTGAPFLALERIAGDPVDRFLARQPPATRGATTLGLFLAAARAGAYLHRRGLLHLDIKPENILVVEGGPGPRPVLIDFGLARAADDGERAVDHATLPYAPPETFQARPQAPASDVYALAATFYRLYSGRHPVAATSFEGYVRAHRRGAAAALPEAPPGIERIVLRALAKDPARRYRDAGELARALAQAPEALTLAGRREVAYHEPDFVGRGRELEALLSWADAGCREHPLFAVIAGSGWGKSRFLEKAQTELEARGRTVYRLGPDPGTHLAFVPVWRRLAASLRSGRPGPSARETKVEIEADAEAAAGIALGPLVELVRGGAFLVLDDLHFADPAELAALAAAVRALGDPGGGGKRGAGGIVVAGHELRATSPPLDDLQSIVELGPLGLEEALRVDLEGLDGALSGIEPGRVRELKARLHAEVGGHPLFFVRGLLALAGDPESADRLVPARSLEAEARRLDGAEREAALFLALLDRPTSAAELATALDAPLAATAGILASLRSRGLVAHDATARLVHELVRDAVLGVISQADRRRARLGLADRLAAAGLPSCAIHAAWHYFEAGDSGRGLEAALRWERQAVREPGVPASRAVDGLLQAARVAGEATPAGLRLLEAAGDALETSGRFEESIAVRERVVPRDGSDSSDDDAPTADVVRRRRKLGAAAHRAGRVDLALAALRRCLEPRAATASPVESLRARADLSLILHYRGEGEEARRHAEAGLEAWRGGSAAHRRLTLQAAVNLHSVLGQIHLRRLDVGPAAKVLEAGVACARRLRSPANTTLLLNSLGLAYHLGGRLDAALATFREAERLGGDLADPAALVSVRTNIAQILARQGQLADAQSLLDDLEEVAAVRQSVRLRLNVTYTRALLLHLAGAPTAEAWQEVERQSAAAGDAFLGRFARLYQAEALLANGDLCRAGELLESIDDPQLHRQALARRAHLAALLERREEAMELRAAALAPPESPAMIQAWILVHCGASALESDCRDEAVRLLERARRLAHGTGFVLAQLECDLCLADLHLRRAALEPEAGSAELRAARRAIEAARQAAAQSLGGLGPRSRELRLALLEARWLLASAVPAGDDAPVRGPRLDDLIASAAGDAALPARPDERCILECLAAVAARQSGAPAHARSALLRLEAAQAEAAARRPVDVAAADPWHRFGLEAHRPPPGPAELEPRHAAALVRILRIAAGGAGLEEALAELGAAIGATRIELRLSGRSLRWGVRAPRGSRAAAREPVLATPLELRGVALGVLAAQGGGGARFTAADEACAAAAAQALAPRLWIESRETLAGSGTPRQGTGGVETQRLPAPAAASRDGTVPLGSARLRPRHNGRTEPIVRSFRAEGMVIAGPRLQKMARTALALAAGDLPILIAGESGTGKSLLGKILHRLGPRADGPYIAQSASAVPLELFEADLFGYERGAFTGADTARTGFLFQASGGTFHLEEVGDLSPELQQRLLRVIEEREVRPLGSTRPRALDVRFLASTQHDLAALVDRGAFRKDLYYRLSAAPIHLPPLRECPEAIPEIVALHWRELTGESVRPTRAVIEALSSHPWPGNVREVITALRRLHVEGEGVLTVPALRQVLGETAARPLFAADLFEGRSFADVEQALEQRYLEHLLEKHRGDLAAIASALGTSTRSVYRRFERLGLKPRSLRDGGR